MSHLRNLLVVATALIPSVASAQGPISGSSSRVLKNLHDGDFVWVQSEYITTDEQRARAQENLRQHREQQKQQGNSTSTVDQSTSSTVNQSTTPIITRPLTPNTDNQSGNR